jgi:crotonobetainyl-CoA:carnitine CoA-transferase CaiB-like acyl-CoA transferase
MGPLHGIRILDLTSVVMGPFATTILGDLGADIIKLESPQGDVVRQIGPSRSGKMGGLFMHANRSKRSIAVDLKSAEGRSLALQLAASCDVVFYNIRPRAMERLGLSFDEVKAAKDDIIYVGALGYGQGGAYSDDPAYDDLIQGLAAIPSLIAETSGGEPRYVPVNIADRMVGIYASTAILAAILHRNATGQGQKVDIPMFETMASVVLGDHLGGRSHVPPLDAGGYRRLLSPARMPTRTADGFLCVLLYTQKNRQDFVTLIEGHDPASAARLRHLVREGGSTPMINTEMAAIFPSRTTAEWEASLRRFDIPHKRLHTIDTLIDDPHLADVGFFGEADHPLEGAVVSMKVPSTWSVSTPEITRLAPLLGEHTARRR